MAEPPVRYLPPELAQDLEAWAPPEVSGTEMFGLQYRQPVDNRSPGVSGDWAYCVCRAGLRFEATGEWWSGARERGEAWGWSRTPAHLVTWDELAALVGQDPRRAEVAAWAASVPSPRWRSLTRPHELWPDPDGWHVGHFCRDHVDVQWSGRRRAWRLVVDLLGEAIDAVGVS